MNRTLWLSLLLLFGLWASSSVSLAGDVGDDVSIVGRGYPKNIYETESGAEIYRFFVIRPSIDGLPVRSAYLKACAGPTEEACELSGLQMVEVNREVFNRPYAYGPIDTYGIITTISRKRYYDTYYMNATADVGY